MRACALPHGLRQLLPQRDSVRVVGSRVGLVVVALIGSERFDIGLEIAGHVVGRAAHDLDPVGRDVGPLDDLGVVNGRAALAGTERVAVGAEIGAITAVLPLVEGVAAALSLDVAA